MMNTNLVSAPFDTEGIVSFVVDNPRCMTRETN